MSHFGERLLIIIVLLYFSFPLFSQQYKYAKISVQLDNQDDVAWLNELGLEVDHAHLHGNKIEFFIRHIDFSVLESNNLSYKVIIPDFEEYYNDLQVKDQANLARVKRNSNVANSFGYGSMGGFYTLAEIEAKLDEMHTLYPDLVQEKFSIGTSIEGRSIWAVKISDNPDIDEAEPAVYYDALTHAREPLSMASTINYMFWMLENYATDPKVKYIIDERELYFVPVVNPDGYEYNRSTNPNGGGFWRKNRRNQPNCIGVDLNRNFSYQFADNFFCASPTQCSDTYRGPSAFSEPETQAVRDFITQIQPSTSFTVHSWTGAYLLPDVDANLDLQYDRYSEWASDFTDENDHIFGTGLDLLGYTACGTTDAYLHSEGVFSWTPEIGFTGFWPAQSDIFDLVGDQVFPFFYQALIAGAYVDVKSTEQLSDAIPGSSFSLAVGLVNKGVNQMASNTSVEIEPITAGISVSAAQNYGTINAEAVADNANTPFAIVVSNGFTGNSFDLDIVAKQQGVEMTRERITIFIGTRQMLFEDDAENGTGNWSSSGQGGNWEICDSDNYGGNNCFCDSNDGASSSNDDKSFTLNQSIDLTNTIAPRLQFFAKWSLERGGADRAFLEINANGIWETLRTYETNSAWRLEDFDLSSYQSSSNFQVRFRLDNNSSENGDGFYFDDFQIVDYDASASNPCASLPQVLEVTTNPSMNETYQAIDSLYSNATIADGLAVNFIAGRVITLDKNFHAENGSTFVARIDNCSTNNAANQAEEREETIVKEDQIGIYPNPFSEQTTIQYELTKNSSVQVTILDLTGKIVEVLLPASSQQAGLHQVNWSASNQQVGLYVVRLQIGERVLMKKLVVVR
ncbi:MAG: M14 family zinc carboxypeptidase [Bacteroidota bacterium]